MLLSKENLSLYRIVSTDLSRPALGGVYVDPIRKLTVASNGAALVEVTAPPGDPKAPAEKGLDPFILPPKFAKQMASELSDGARAAVERVGKKLTLSSKSFDPIVADYPDYAKAGLFAGNGQPTILSCDAKYLEDVLKAASIGETVQVTLSADRIRLESDPRDVEMAIGKSTPGTEGKKRTFNSEFLRQLLAASAIGKSVTLTLFNDRLTIESKKDGGQSARAVLMSCGQPAEEPKAEVKVKKAPVPVATPPVAAMAEPDPAPAHVRHTRHWGHRPYVPKEGDDQKPPTEPQRMFYTYLLRRKGEKVTPELLASTDFVGKIEEMKQGLSYDAKFATWPQWKKMNYLLLERKAEPQTVCEVLNGITDVKTASLAIKTWSEKPAPVAA